MIKNINEDNENVAKKLKQLRVEANLNQNEVADRLGISQQTYSKYENGISSPDSIVLKKICNLYGVTADYVLGIDEQSMIENAPKNEQSAYVDKIVSKVIERIKKG